MPLAGRKIWFCWASLANFSCYVLFVWQSAHIPAGKTKKVIWQSCSHFSQAATTRGFLLELFVLCAATTRGYESFPVSAEETGWFQQLQKKRDYCCIKRQLLSRTKVKQPFYCDSSQTSRQTSMHNQREVFFLIIIRKKVSKAKPNANAAQLCCSYTSEVSADTSNLFASFMSCISFSLEMYEG